MFKHDANDFKHDDNNIERLKGMFVSSEQLNQCTDLRTQLNILGIIFYNPILTILVNEIKDELDAVLDLRLMCDDVDIFGF